MLPARGIKQENYLLSSIWFLFFFICWGACFPWLSLWLTEKIGIDSTEVGMVYTCIAIVAVVFQPVFGILADKLNFRKHLMWMLAGLMIAFAPWWIFVFAPLLKINIILGLWRAACLLAWRSAAAAVFARHGLIKSRGWKALSLAGPECGEASAQR